MQAVLTPPVHQYPAPQSMLQAKLVPTKLHFPSSQFPHVLIFLAAIEVENLPTSQEIQVDIEEAVDILEYVPASHAVFKPPLQKYPSPQSSVQAEFALAIDHLPGAQFKHVSIEVAATVVEYFPGKHDTQVEIKDAVVPDEYVPAIQTVFSPSLQKYPAPQFRLQAESLPATDHLPGAQNKQVATEVAATVVE